MTEIIAARMICFRGTALHWKKLELLAVAEGRMVTPSQMLRLLVERADLAAKVAPAAKKLVQDGDDRAMRRVREGMEAALAKRFKGTGKWK